MRMSTKPPDWDEPEISYGTEPTDPGGGPRRTPNGTAPPAHTIATPQPAPQPPQRKRRGHNGADDVIESGEINTDRRSLVVRSHHNMPAATWNEGPTEISAPALPVAPAKRSYVLPIIFGLAAIASGVVAMMMMRSSVSLAPDPAKVSALEISAEAYTTKLDGAADTALGRAKGIAMTPVLVAAIDTDADTLADMLRSGDAKLQLEKGDVVEFYQMRAGQRMLMLRIPQDAKPLAPPAAGLTRIGTANDQIVALATAPVLSQQQQVAGEIVLATRVDLSSVTQRISEQASGAVLNGLDKAIVLIANSAPPNVTIPIRTKTASLSIAAVVAPPARPNPTLAWVAAGASALLLAMAAVFFVRARRAT